jgi:hypothetical protein
METESVPALPEVSDPFHPSNRYYPHMLRTTNMTVKENRVLINAKPILGILKQACPPSL